MRTYLRLALGSAVLAVGLGPTVDAQMNEASYVVTYIEVTPAATIQAIDLLVAHAEASRDEDGNSRFQVLQRIGRSNHFALLETWVDADAQATHAAAARTRTFRANLEPLLYSPYDERRHTQVEVAHSDEAENAIYGLTHVDVIPTNLDIGVGYLRTLIAASRQDAGNVRFDVLAQDSRRNHMTLVESWESAEDQAAHSAAAHSREFRDALLPLSGSLYDERLYTRL
jgi:quinol monooxygenase YgiN